MCRAVSSLDYLVVEVTEVSTACHGAQVTLHALGKEQDAVAEEDRCALTPHPSPSPLTPRPQPSPLAPSP